MRQGLPITIIGLARRVRWAILVVVGRFAPLRQDYDSRAREVDTIDARPGRPVPMRKNPSCLWHRAERSDQFRHGHTLTSLSIGTPPSHDNPRTGSIASASSSDLT